MPVDIYAIISSNVSKNEEKANTTLPKEAEITDPDIIIEKSQDVNFVTRAFGTSVGTRSLMEETMINGLVKAILFEDTFGKYIQDTSEMNLAIKKFQESLFNKLKEYVQFKSRSETIEDLTLYDEDFEYNANSFESFIKNNSAFLKNIFPNLSFQISGNSDGRMTVGNLDNLYSQYSKYRSSKLELDAYIAYFLLLHFDDMVKRIYPSMIIRRSKWNKFETDNFDKYTLGSGAHVLQGWQDQEKEVMPEELMNDVTKELIRNIDIYKFGSGDSTNSKVAVSDFNRIISKIKYIAYTTAAHKLVPTDSDLYNIIISIYGEEIFDGEVTLYKILGNLNMDGACNYQKLFQLLSTETFWKFYAPSDIPN